MRNIKKIVTGLLISICLFSCEPCSAWGGWEKPEEMLLDRIYEEVRELRKGQSIMISLMNRVDEAEEDVKDLENNDKEHNRYHIKVFTEYNSLVEFYDTLREREKEYSNMTNYYESLKKKKIIGITSGPQQ